MSQFYEYQIIDEVEYFDLTTDGGKIHQAFSSYEKDKICQIYEQYIITIYSDILTIVNKKSKSIEVSIDKLDDEWFLVTTFSFPMNYIYYKCDQFGGLLILLEDLL